MNVLLAGSGTLISAVFNVNIETSPLDPQMIVRKSKISKTTLIIAILQMLMAWIIIGWIWSIYWGYLIYKKGLEEE